MGSLVFGFVLLAIAFFLRLGAATVRADSGGGVASYVAMSIGVVMVLLSMFVVVDAGKVGVRHAFGSVDPKPLRRLRRFPKSRWA